MGLFWSENKETVSNAELKTLIEGIPTESEMPSIIKNNAGGTDKEYIFRKGSTVLLSKDDVLSKINGTINLMSFVSIYSIWSVSRFYR